MNKEHLSATLQESLLVLLCFDDKNALLIRQNAPSRLFNEEYRPIVREIYKYIDKFHKPPKAHTDELFESLAKSGDEDDQEYLWEILDLIADVKEDINPDWTMKRLDAFVRVQEFKQTIWDVADLMQGDVDDETADEIGDKLADATRKRVASSDLGRRLSDPESLSFLNRRENALMPLGIHWFDRHDIGPTRGELLLLSAIYGAGKSHFLIHCGKKALMQRWNVLHISLEMSAEIVEQRYHQTLFGVAKFNEDVGRYEIDADEYGKLERLNWIRHSPEHHMEDPDIRSYLEKKRKDLGKMMDRIWIKQFPSNFLTTQSLESYLDLLEYQESFIPDIILMDYIDIMKTRPDLKRHDISDHAKGLRKIAFERDCAVVTVGQLNREAMKSKRKAGHHMAEDIGKGREADIHLIYDQTEQEEKMGLARLSIDKVRNAPGHKTILLSQSYAFGQFCLGSALFDQTAKDAVKHFRPGTEEEEEEEEPEGFL